MYNAENNLTVLDVSACSGPTGVGATLWEALFDVDRHTIYGPSPIQPFVTVASSLCISAFDAHAGLS